MVGLLEKALKGCYLASDWLNYCGSIWAFVYP